MSKQQSRETSKKVKAPIAVEMSPIQERAIGALYGQCIGDALGTRYEFGSSQTTITKIRNDIKAHMLAQSKSSSASAPIKHLPILGGGPFSVAKGQVTDDTELAMGLARSLIRCKDFDIFDIAQSYTYWFHSHPFDIGSTTRTAFYPTSLKDTPEENYHAILASSNDPHPNKGNNKSLSNGCLMRISPLAIAGTHWKTETLIAAAQMDCQLTNPNPTALNAVSIYVAAIRTAILTGDRHEAILAAIDAATDETLMRHIEAGVQGDGKEFPPIQLEGGKKVMTDGQFQGYLGVALQNAFYELAHGTSFYRSLVNIVARGGDTDTNACIAGALLGAIYGYKDMPNDWKRALLTAQPGLGRAKSYKWGSTADIETVALQLLKTPEPQMVDDITETLIEDKDSDNEAVDVQPGELDTVAMDDEADENES